MCKGLVEHVRKGVCIHTRLRVSRDLQDMQRACNRLWNGRLERGVDNLGKRATGEGGEHVDREP